MQHDTRSSLVEPGYPGYLVIFLGIRTCTLDLLVVLFSIVGLSEKYQMAFIHRLVNHSSIN